MMKKTISVLTWVLVLTIASFITVIPAASSGLSITTSTSSSEIATGSSITLTVQVSNTGTTSQSGVTIEVDLSSANGGLSLNATTTDLQDQTESQTISAGGSVTKTWTIYGFSAGTYTNQIQINVKQSGTDITGSPVYESVSVKDPARFATPAIATTTSVDLGDTFTFNLTTQNSGDYAIQNAIASISAPGFTVEGSSGTTSTSIASDAIFTPGWTLTATSSGTKTVTVTLSADNAASITASETITVSDTSTPTSTSTPTPTSTQNQVGGGGGGGSSTTTNIPIDIYGKVKSTTVLRSDDEKASLTIEEGTVAMSRHGSSVSYISMIEVSFEDAILAYEFGPNGATFNPAIELEFRYDPADIPDNADEEDLVIKVYENGSWRALDTTVDTTTHTATTEVEHFTPFALMLPEIIPPLPEGYFEEITATPSANSSEETGESATALPEGFSGKGNLVVGVILIVAIIAAGIGVYYYKKR